MNGNNCKTIQKKLDLYAGDDLDGREAAEVSAHLKSCLACYRDFAELRDLLVSVRSTRHDGGDGTRGDAESESLVAGVMQQIHGPPPPAPQLLARLSLVSGWAAALLLGITLGWRTFAGPVAPPDADRGDRVVPRLIDRGGSDPRLSTVEYGVDDELGRQLDELRRNNPRGSPAPRTIPVSSKARRNL